MPVESLHLGKAPNLVLRGITPADLEKIRQILDLAGNFRPEESHTALEMARLTLVNPAAHEYEYIVAVNGNDDVLGFACFGANSLTKATFDLYWLAVHKQCQGSGIGKALVSQVINILRERGAWLLVAETSSLPSYVPAHKLYESLGFIRLAVINDFYDIGDHKLIYGLYPRLNNSTPRLEAVPIKGGAQE